MISIEPMFNTGPVPGIPWCHIQDMEETSGADWHYFIHNRYNAYASGWMTENDVIAEISKAKRVASLRTGRVSTAGGNARSAS